MFFQKFDEVLLETVDSARTREAVYFDLETALCLPRLRISLRFEEIDEVLRAVCKCCAGFWRN
jgi:hypothetical protein